MFTEEEESTHVFTSVEGDTRFWSTRRRMLNVLPPVSIPHRQYDFHNVQFSYPIINQELQESSVQRKICTCFTLYNYCHCAANVSYGSTAQSNNFSYSVVPSLSGQNIVSRFPDQTFNQGSSNVGEWQAVGYSAPNVSSTIMTTDETIHHDADLSRTMSESNSNDNEVIVLFDSKNVDEAFGGPSMAQKKTERIGNTNIADQEGEFGSVNYDVIDDHSLPLSLSLDVTSEYINVGENENFAKWQCLWDVGVNADGTIDANKETFIVQSDLGDNERADDINEKFEDSCSKATLGEIGKDDNACFVVSFKNSLQNVGPASSTTIIANMDGTGSEQGKMEGGYFSGYSSALLDYNVGNNVKANDAKKEDRECDGTCEDLSSEVFKKSNGKDADDSTVEVVFDRIRDLETECESSERTSYHEDKGSRVLGNTNSRSEGEEDNVDGIKGEDFQSQAKFPEEATQSIYSFCPIDYYRDHNSNSSGSNLSNNESLIRPYDTSYHGLYRCNVLKRSSLRPSRSGYTILDDLLRKMSISTPEEEEERASKVKERYYAMRAACRFHIDSLKLKKDLKDKNGKEHSDSSAYLMAASASTTSPIEDNDTQNVFKKQVESYNEEGTGADESVKKVRDRKIISTKINALSRDERSFGPDKISEQSSPEESCDRNSSMIKACPEETPSNDCSTRPCVRKGTMVMGLPIDSKILDIVNSIGRTRSQTHMLNNTSTLSLVEGPSKDETKMSSGKSSRLLETVSHLRVVKGRKKRRRQTFVWSKKMKTRSKENGRSNMCDKRRNGINDGEEIVPKKRSKYLK